MSKQDDDSTWPPVMSILAAIGQPTSPVEAKFAAVDSFKAAPVVGLDTSDQAAIASFFDQHPVLLQYKLEDPQRKEEVVEDLVFCLREHGKKSPLLAWLANLLDPESEEEWKLELGQRGAGRLEKIETYAEYQQWSDEVDQVAAEMEASGDTSPRTNAILEVADRKGKSKKTIERAIAIVTKRRTART